MEFRQSARLGSARLGSARPTESICINKYVNSSRKLRNKRAVKSAEQTPSWQPKTVERWGKSLVCCHGDDDADGHFWWYGNEKSKNKGKRSTWYYFLSFQLMCDWTAWNFWPITCEWTSFTCTQMTHIIQMKHFLHPNCEQAGYSDEGIWAHTDKKKGLTQLSITVNIIVSLMSFFWRGFLIIRSWSELSYTGYDIDSILLKGAILVINVRSNALICWSKCKFCTNSHVLGQTGTPPQQTKKSVFYL